VQVGHEVFASVIVFQPERIQEFLKEGPNAVAAPDRPFVLPGLKRKRVEIQARISTGVDVNKIQFGLSEAQSEMLGKAHIPPDVAGRRLYHELQGGVYPL
jgi:hypothetical protein